MNSVNLVGRITKDLELRYTTSNKAVCEFSLAVNRIGEGTDFVTCQVWGTQAENLTKYQGKGSLIGILGSIRVDTYEVEGQKRYKTYVLCSNVEYLGTKKETTQEVKPSDFAKEETQDPFELFGEQVSIDDNFLD